MSRKGTKTPWSRPRLDSTSVWKPASPGDAGFQTDVESKRGLDHGVFVPFLLIYPNADVPLLQLSLQASLDPALPLALGSALAPPRGQVALIVGSAMSS